LQVFTKDLGLTANELKIFLEMVGKRYNQGKREVKIICDRFPNRIENKKFVVLTLERLISESKRLDKLIASGKLE
jgi:hypothetical protein